MKHLRVLSIITLVPFTVLTGLAIYNDGLLEIFATQFATYGGAQVLIDLVIACMFFLAWMIPHARSSGRNPWFYVAVTLIAGSYGPLLYFALAPPAEA